MAGKDREHNIAIVLSAGRGSRMHMDTPKQYLDLCGRPVIAWSLRAFEEFDGVDDIILVCSGEDIGYCRSEIVDCCGFTKVRSIVAGGAERFLSVWEGLKEADRLLDARGISNAVRGAFVNHDSLLTEKSFTEKAQEEKAASYVFIHDGARPLVQSDILQNALDDVRKYQACVVGMPVKDTIKVADEEGFAAQTPDRRYLWQIQTPQVFSFPLVYEAYRRLIEEEITDVTDDAMVVERETSVRVKLTEGSYRNIKITTPEDLEIAGLFMKNRVYAKNGCSRDVKVVVK